MKPPSRAERTTMAYQKTTGPIGRACPRCDAEPGYRCVKWKTDKGERLYIQSTLVNFHRVR